MKNIRPKQYTNINYEALIIYAMKNRVSIEKAILENGLNIARSTVARNIEKKPDNEVFKFYKEIYVPNMQKKESQEYIQGKIDEFQRGKVKKEEEIAELYKKLIYMKNIIEQCNGDFKKASEMINSGTTILGKKHISIQGLYKNMKILKKVEEFKRCREINIEEKGGK